MTFDFRSFLKTPWAYLVLIVLVSVAGYSLWQRLHPAGPGDGFASGNGRVEATEVDIATKMPGRLDAVLVKEGDFVKAGQLLARMQVASLQAQRQEAAAMAQQARDGVKVAEAQVLLRESDLAAAQSRLKRSEALARDGAVSGQELDDDRARVQSLKATVAAAQAEATSTRSRVKASEATLARIDADLADSNLVAPIDGRVQYRVAEPGEVLGAGGKVLSLVDLTDVYMTFFLPETVAGKVALGSDARIILDVAPQYVVPARISFVASTAQFTPKTVETASERQKLMFRVKARIDRDLLIKYRDQVKVGLPGVAWVKLDPKASWPALLEPKVPAP